MPPSLKEIARIEAEEAEADQQEAEEHRNYVPVMTSKGLKLMQMDDVLDEADSWR